MKSNLFALLILLGIGWHYKHKFSSYFGGPEISQEFATFSECRHKKYCAIVYMAPWCSACKQMQPSVTKTLLNLHSQETGMVVIMGDERAPGQNEQAAKQISEKVILDKDNAYKRALGITYFPTFFVLDAKQRVLMKDQEAINWISKLN